MRSWWLWLGLVGCDSDASALSYVSAEAYGDSGYFGGGGGAAAPDDDLGAEQEAQIDDGWLAPAATPAHVFIANGERDTVTRVSVADLSAITAPVGDNPTVVVTSADQSLAVVLNQGSDSLSLVDTASLAVQSVDIRPDMNAVVLSADGRWAACFHDEDAREDGDLDDGAWSLNEVSLVDVAAGTHTPMIVGFHPRELVFSQDSQRLVVVSDATLAVIDLSVDTPSPARFDIADGAVDVPPAEELVLTPDGAQAIVRQFGSNSLLVVDLNDGGLESLPAGLLPTDLDVTPDGAQVVAVARESSELWVYTLADLAVAPTVVPLPDGTVLGSLTMSPSGDQALLYSTVSGQARFARWDRTATDDPITVYGAVKPIMGVDVSPDGRVAVLSHPASDGDIDPESVFAGEHAISLVDLSDFFTNPIRLPAEPSALAQTESGELGYLIMDGEDTLVQLDYGRLIHHDIPLPSETEHVGVLPGTSSAWVSQTHELGRISFVDADTRSLRTITGFELNAGVDVE